MYLQIGCIEHICKPIPILLLHLSKKWIIHIKPWNHSVAKDALKCIALCSMKYYAQS